MKQPLTPHPSERRARARWRQGILQRHGGDWNDRALRDYSTLLRSRVFPEDKNNG